MSNQYEITATVFDKRGRVLGTGTNSYTKTHPHQKHLASKVGLHEKIYVHAEVLAIIRASKVGKPHTISIERYGKDGRPLNSEPCPICKLCIKESGINFVKYTIS
jgi:deoxycytidylate deaminase